MPLGGWYNLPGSCGHLPRVGDGGFERRAQGGVVCGTALAGIAPGCHASSILADKLGRVMDSRRMGSGIHWVSMPVTLADAQDANVRFFSAHTAQVKISRDW